MRQDIDVLRSSTQAQTEYRGRWIESECVPFRPNLYLLFCFAIHHNHWCRALTPRMMESLNKWGVKEVIRNNNFYVFLSTDHLPTTCRPPADLLPTINQPLTDHLLTDHLPTTYWPSTDHLPTTYRPPTNHLPTTYRPLTDHLPTTYRPLTDHFFMVQLVHDYPVHSSVGRALHRYHGGHGFESFGASEFLLGFICNCLRYFITVRG